MTGLLTAAEVATLSRDVATLPPGCTSALDRETALAVLSQLEDLRRSRRRAPHYIFCPYCGEGFDRAHGLRTDAPRPDDPQRHLDPIGAAATVRGADQAARALAKAMSWRNERYRGPDRFWVDFGRVVLCPMLLLARAAEWDMDDVRLLAHPARLTETLATVTAGLEALEPGPDGERARREWTRIMATDGRTLRTAFGYAYSMVHHWQLGAPWAYEDAPLG